ncbi:PREDICTED: LOW QUALITY PROTEIN: quinone oxidoreductase-like protein 2 [Condylura cristata]|uniref:LOW QUALITY PROTEIN: quinone oxidoreductase-like protein 2 n=1 Tax=Condylura cristata TaxID=143302 RepID=UPI0006429C82|nr:PREDICTED: LOW QUALITY PROTEIN: quinone oxidoreductase-like protein 2 [Condylura cristata]
MRFLLPGVSAPFWGAGRSTAPALGTAPRRGQCWESRQPAPAGGVTRRRLAALPLSREGRGGADAPGSSCRARTTPRWGLRWAMAAALWGRCFPRAWLCRKAGPGCSRHYRAALCTRLKQPLAIEEVAPSPVRPHEVRVGVHFCGVNFADILVCRGQYQEKPHLPFVPGMEFSGTVLEAGTDVSTVKEGDRVIGVSGFNGMAEECITDQKMLWQIPDSVSLREAAALPVSYCTAILALEHRACTQPGETVLVTAAAGATGLAVIDVATNVLQAKVIAAAGSDEKCQLAMRRGAQATLNYGQGSLKEAVRKLVGSGGVNVAIDTVGGDVFLEALRSLAWEGRIVVVGFAGGTIASLPANLLLLKNISAMGLYWGRYQRENFPVFSRSLSSALQYCQQGLIQPYIGAVFKLEEVNDAFFHVIQRKSTGKVLISLK